MTPGQRSKASFIKVEAWRKHPLLKTSLLRHGLPGFLLGGAAFAVVSAFEMATESKKPHA